MAYGAVNVTDTATLILAANVQRQGILLVNADEDDTVYLGMDASVTVANGLPFYSNSSRQMDRGFGLWLGPIYGICDTGAAASVRYWEVTKGA